MSLRKRRRTTCGLAGHFEIIAARTVQRWGTGGTAGSGLAEDPRDHRGHARGRFGDREQAAVGDYLEELASLRRDVTVESARVPIAEALFDRLIDVDFG